MRPREDGSRRPTGGNAAPAGASAGGWPDLVLSAGIIAVIFVVLVPLPPFLMDVLLIINLTGSLLVLVTVSSTARPLELSVFPSIILMATFFRLALNLATTRLILGNAAERGVSAAGRVVETFSGFVTEGSLAVGLILFSIMAVVQFVVITKGASRISEVAARFTLDALPGKQLSIDADLAAGLAGEEEARRRRRELAAETEFYGAMDGAGKLLRGEAIAAVLILAANMAGGITLGVLRHGMDVSQAAGVFTRLTVGEGLVNQVPALMISVAGALLITRSSGGERLGRDLAVQLFSNERASYVAAVFLLALLPTGIPAPLLLAGAALCAAAGWAARAPLAGAAGAGPIAEEASPAGEAPPEKARDLLIVEPIELEVGYRLVGLVDASSGGDLMPRLARVREKIAVDLGLILPALRVRDNTRLHPSEYSIKLRGNGVGRWRLRPGRALLVTDGEPVEGIEGAPGVDPSTGRAGLWIPEEQGSLAASAGFALRRSSEIIASHLDSVLRSRAAEVLTREEVSRLVGDLRKRAPALVDELIPGTLKLGEVHKVLQNLLREQVSIRDLETILETLADHGGGTRDPAELTERVRRALARTICGSLAEKDGVIRALFLDPALEEFLQASMERTGQGARFVFEPELVDTLISSTADAVQRAEEARRRIVLACPGAIRASFRALIARRVPLLPVLAYEEVSDDYRLEAAGSVAVEKVVGEQMLS